MRIAIVSPHSPVPPDSGDRIRTSTLAVALERAGVDTRVFAYDWGSPTEQVPWLELVPVARRSQAARLRWRLDLARRRRTNPYAIHDDRRVRSAMADALERFDPDVVDFQHSHTWFAQPRPSVVTLHNVESVRHGAAGARARVVEGLTRLEREVLRRADAAVVFSAVDRDRLAEIAPLSDPVIVPIGYAPPSSVHPIRPELRVGAFVGSFDYAPNREAAGVLLDLWPRLRAETTLERLVLIGRDADHHLEGGGDVEIRSDVADVSRALQDADVLLVPLRHGGGVRVKIIEALALGVPVVTTSVGAEGLGIDPGVQAVVVDEVTGAPGAGAFVGAARSIEGQRRRLELAASGRTLWEQRYSPEVMAARMREVYEAVQRDISQDSPNGTHARTHEAN